MKNLVQITAIILASALSFPTTLMAQSNEMNNDADYKDRTSIDAAFKKELMELGFKDGAYPDVDESTSAHLPYVLINKVVHTQNVSATRPDGTTLKGRVPTDVNQQQLINASKLSCVGAINLIKNAADGDLSQVRKIANIRFLTLSASEYTDYADVSNACSEMMVRVFGSTVGSHTRFAIGLVSSPMNETFKLNLVAYLK